MTTSWKTAYKYNVGEGKEVTIAEANVEEMHDILCDSLQGDSGYRYEDISDLLHEYRLKVVDEYCNS